MVLFAMFWGSVIGLRLAQRYPEKIEMIISYGQVIHPLGGQRLSYDWLRQKARTERSRRLLKWLRILGKPPYHDRVLEHSAHIPNERDF